MAIIIRPVTGVIGAEVEGVDLSGPMPAADVEQLRDALHRHLVLFFLDQRLTDASHRDAAARFGELESFVLAPGTDPTVPEVHALAFDDGAKALGSRVDSWHTDGSFMNEPPLATMLRAVELPPHGGDTCWANMYEAFDALSPAMQTMVESLEAEHDFAKVVFTTFDGADDPEAELRKVRARHPPVRHPLVLRHPVTGRRALYCSRNYVRRVVGLTERENEILMPFLFDHVRDPRFQCRFRWRPGAVAFWDNLATQHYGVPDYAGPRVMHRVVLRGGGVAPGGR